MSSEMCIGHSSPQARVCRLSSLRFGIEDVNTGAPCVLQRPEFANRLIRLDPEHGQLNDELAQFRTRPTA